MDGSGIDWDAGVAQSQAPLAGFRQGQEAAAAGIELRQKAGAAHALQGIDLSNPASIDAGIGGLVRNNAVEQAGALQNLNWTRYLRSQAPEVLAKLNGLAGKQPEPADQSSSAPDHYVETLNMAKGAVEGIAQLSPEERPAAFADTKKKMLERGLPEAAIDKAGSDLSDAGLKGLSDYYGSLIAHADHQMNPQEGATPPAFPGPHPTNNWYDRAVSDPGLAGQVALLKGGGLDLSPILDLAKTLAAPGIQKAADLQYARPIAEATAPVDVAKSVATAAGTAPIDVQKAVQTKAGTLPYEVMQKKLEADIAAAHDTLEVPVKDADGNVHTELYRKDVALKRGAAGPIGANLAPSEQAGRNEDASLFMSNYAKDANQGAIQSDLTARDTAVAAARMAQSPEINPSNLTDWAARNANALSAFGIDKKQANNLATYKNLVDQNLKNGIAVFPRNEVEFHAIANGVANAKMPGDAAALALTETAALRGAQAAYKQFRIAYAAQHPNAFSERAFQTAWSHQPEANQSIFASPVFRDLKFNGKPAVAIMQKPYSDGHIYGVFMPGTPQKTVFKVR